MAILKVFGAQASLTADGTVAGYATIPDATRFPAGTICYLSATGQPTLECVVTDIRGATQVGLRQTNPTGSPTYGKTNIGAYTVASAATLTCDNQVVFNNDPAAVNVQVDSSAQAPVPTTGALAVLDKTTVVLAGAATYIGAAQVCGSYKTINATAFADQTGTVLIEQSFDPAFGTIDASATSAVTASTPTTLTAARVAPYCRLKYTNGVTIQGTFRAYLSGSTV